MSALARGIGPTVAGFIYAGIAPSAPFLISGAILVGGVGLALVAVRKVNKQSTGQDHTNQSIRP